MPRHELTDDERRKGRAKDAQKRRECRQAVEEASREKLLEAVEQAVAPLVAELQADGSFDRIRAAVAIIDRVLGRPRQALIHSGEIEIRRAEFVDQAKRELQADYAREMPAMRARLDELLERRARSENGDA